uniref:Uncharacterized protein TCIL3000_5_3140 n=1 Tax=Trypanosoma congolense (strain IL3000) TaxID=1068625 RepID=G0ULS8_TRYCI|nr:unnamed protein product [Trypanosoma congolense IL3000]
MSDVNRSFRRIVLKVHPDKCSLEKAADAFHVAEGAHKLLSNEAAFVRLKIAYEKKKEREAALKEEAAKRQSRETSGATNSGHSTDPNVSVAERQRRRRHEQMLEQQMEATRLAEEAARKKQRIERETKEKAELASELERQRKQWKDLNLF